MRCSLCRWVSVRSDGGEVAGVGGGCSSRSIGGGRIRVLLHVQRKKTFVSWHRGTTQRALAREQSDCHISSRLPHISHESESDLNAKPSLSAKTSIPCTLCFTFIHISYPFVQHTQVFYFTFRHIILHSADHTHYARTHNTRNKSGEIPHSRQYHASSRVLQSTQLGRRFM